MTESRLINEDAISFIFSIGEAMLQTISSGRLEGEYRHFGKIFSSSQILYEPLLKNIGEKCTTIKNRVRCVIHSCSSTGSLDPHSEHKKTSGPKRQKPPVAERPGNTPVRC